MTLLETADMLADVLGIENVYAGCIDAIRISWTFRALLTVSTPITAPILIQVRSS